MNSRKDIEKLIAGYELPAKNGVDERNIRDAMMAFEKSKTTKTADKPRIWGMIVKSRITKFASAAVLMFAALAGIIFMERLVTPAYGINDIPRLITNAKTIHIKCWFISPVIGETNVEPDIDDWIDIQSGCSRTSIIYWSVGPSGKKAKPNIKVFDGCYEMELNPNIKTAKYNKLSSFQSSVNSRREINRFLQSISLTPKVLSDYAKVGQEKIDGVKYDIWERLTSHSTQDKKSETKNLMWVSADTGKLRKQELWGKGKNTEEKWLLSRKTEIEIDSICPEGIFKTIPPQGYKERNTKETAPSPSLESCTIYRNSIKQGCIVIVFALSAGDAIISWQFDEVAPGTDYAEILRGLKLGDDLPKKPFEITCNLPRGDTTDDITFRGRHLAFTQKDGKFYEWAIYIRDKKYTPQTGQRYNLKPQWNDDVNEVGNGFRSVESIFVEESEFNFWVHGAMAELSDNGIVPEQVTYNNIIKMAEEIRMSVK